MQNRLKSYYKGLLGFNVTISSINLLDQLINLGCLNLYFFCKIEKNCSPTTFNLSTFEKIRPDSTEIYMHIHRNLFRCKYIREKESIKVVRDLR